ncbi:hypothetical protein L9F63_017190, partial [Diploptera punctata]
FLVIYPIQRSHVLYRLLQTHSLITLRTDENIVNKKSNYLGLRMEHRPSVKMKLILKIKSVLTVLIEQNIVKFYYRQSCRLNIPDLESELEEIFYISADP